MHKNLLAKSVRLAMISGAAAAALSSPVAFAAEEGAKVERISVTGSRIKRTDMETASPITVVTAEQMNLQGIQDVGQFLQNSSVMSGSPAMTTTNNGGNGGTFVELRGLGTSRTLVLVNGRRPVSSDFQNIPSSMIERIEVLKDGASATYGADAVAGVVNIITRSDFEGLEITAQAKNSFDVDENSQTSFSLVAGKAFDDGHLVFGVDWVKQDEVYQGDTSIDYLNYPWQVWGEDAEESFWKNGLIGTGDNANVIEVGSGSVPCGNFYLASGGASQTNGTCDGGIATIDDMRDFVGGGPNNDTYNYAPVNYLQTPYEKLNIFVEGKFDLTDNMRAYTETRINKRESRQELAAVPYDTRFDPGYSGVTPDGTEFNGVSVDNFYNPFGEDVVRSRRRMLEGGRSFEQDITRYQQVIGFEGELGDNYYYDVNYNYGHSQTISTDFGQLYGPNLAKAMGPSFQDAEGNIVCGTAASPISDCVSMNVFGGPGSVTQEMLDYVTAPLVDSDIYTLQTVTAFIGGDLFELPAGIMTGGVGYEYRDEEYKARRDSGKFMGEVTGNKSKGTQGRFNVNSLFAEFRIPVLSDLPLVESLELPVGVRYDDFSAFGGSTTYQLGAEWKVIDGLMVRSTYGTVFRAPTISNLYSPESDSFPSATDPCSTANWATLSAAQQGYCMADGVPTGGSNNLDAQQLAQVGGNEDLQPEEGDTFTVGFAYSPDFLEGFGLTVDYWSIEIDDVIDSIGADDSLKGCYYGGIESLCANIERTNGELSYISEKDTNLSRMTAKGVDFDANYAFSALAGDFNLNLSWTHFLERENQVYNSDTFAFEMEDLNGRFENDVSYATDKANFTANYTWEDLTIAYAANYISSLQYDDLLYWGTTLNDPNDPNSGNHQYEVDSYFYHDISATYNFDTGTKISVGVENFTDEEPPYIEPAFNGNTDESTYRLFGASWFARISQKF
ncbi:TonB-dependent receptor [Shewanella sp. 1_MG-2023]|uniref:TonB-dependent receptor domain-containing protein n=1 Tax=unclassified Shewanella TaxID=196818 RepID=UPI0026E1840A|nr:MULTISPECIES: TonB-dependent receptor [unclassified Shewanella]MDO6612243.1 TonB-dependent receptor [Shewanella sp. 7_MG-2023]MDO6772097.1 TonB-dependent receptor [Shewanella sp. 2_MG-2023]MDO6796062.1 TonB-dependent receptor [Shewanella sp. 1_MG-2023]